MIDDYTAETQVIGPDEARRILTEERYRFQRKLRPDHIAYLAEAMKAGQFRPGTSIDFAVLKKERYLVNGQHTLAAIFQTRIPQRLQVTLYPCATMEEVDDLYELFDRHLMRSPRDSVGNLLKNEHFRMSNDMFQAIYAGIFQLAAGFSQLPYSTGTWYRAQLRNTRLHKQLMLNWEDEITQWLEDLRGKPRPITRLLTRGTVVAVALATYRFTGADATEFWGGLAADDGLSQGDPRKSLIMFLIEKSPGGINRSTYARYVASAWNSWCDDKTRASLRVSKSPAIRINNTPHDGKQVMVYLNQEGIYHDPVPVQPGEARLPEIAA